MFVPFREPPRLAIAGFVLLDTTEEGHEREEQLSCIHTNYQSMIDLLRVEARAVAAPTVHGVGDYTPLVFLSHSKAALQR